MRLLMFASLMLLSGCSTYYLSPQSLQSQLRNGSPDKGIIKCTDKEGHDYDFIVTQHSSVRVIYNDDTKNTFYLSTITLRDSVITGSKSTFFNIPIKPAKVSDIKKIELQH